jgi:hypothetical protein
MLGAQHTSLPMLATKAIAVWLLILLFAFANGALRELLLVPALGSPVAQVASGLLLSLVILAVAVLVAPWFGRLKASQALLIGLLWLCLTLAFEFGFGVLVQHKSWSALLEAYTFKNGNLWPVVLVVTMFAPLVAARFRRLV